VPQRNVRLDKRTSFHIERTARYGLVLREHTASAFSEPHELVFLVLATVTNYLEDEHPHSRMRRVQSIICQRRLIADVRSPLELSP